MKMKSALNIYNTLTREKEKFEPINPPFVGIYVCGPTVYSDPHLGHARVNIVFDILYRYLKYLGYKVRYVRNITDVGHLEDEAEDSGEDKISKRARQEQLQPMEVVQRYMNNFHHNMNRLNILSPDIEPRATGHIIEQQEMIKVLLEKGYAYESNGSVYFDVEKYNKKYHYGILSGRVLEDQLSNTRKLEGQDEKRNTYDFSLWKKASPEHLMRWPSPWSDGFPGWHLECSAMSLKYLGEPFDIHGGGMDLQFPHHECEIAQSTAVLGKQPIKYWMHNNMITIGGQKMARSLNNFITLDQLFSGEHQLLEQAYSPMTVRFYILRSQYRNTLDFSNKALKEAEVGLQKIFSAIMDLEGIPEGKSSGEGLEERIKQLSKKSFSAMNDDLNTAIVIAVLYEAATLVKEIKDGGLEISLLDLSELKTFFKTFVVDILGLKESEAVSSKKSTQKETLLEQLMERVLSIRFKEKSNKNWIVADRIRDELSELGITIKDTKDSSTWEL
jgi:cysteinyl-tRNA synthetase